MVHDRGEAVVYRSKIEDGTGKPYRERCHKLTWDAIDEDEDYQDLEDMKADRMENYEDEAYYKDDEDGGESAVEPDELRRDGRDEVIREMAADGMTQKEIGEIVGLDRTTVSKIVNADG
jgi:predicted XRE-type DNA-binding protein